MDALVVSGIFVGGVGIGVALVGSWNSTPAVPKPCTCECHCAAPIVPRESSLSLVQLFWFVILILAVILAGFAFVGLFVFTRAETPAKGKGKKGTFGAGVPLFLKDGQSPGR